MSEGLAANDFPRVEAEFDRFEAKTLASRQAFDARVRRNREALEAALEEAGARIERVEARLLAAMRSAASPNE